jgi:hypothetical protein
MRAKQTLRDSRRLLERKSLISPDVFIFVKALNVGYSKKKLLEDACEIATRIPCAQPDRICARLRDALLCWYCVHAPLHPPPPPKRKKAKNQSVIEAQPDDFAAELYEENVWDIDGGF